MEYLEHGDLDKYVRQIGPCSENDAKVIAYQLLKGLHVMHEMNLAHRDLKPQVSP
jgi:serine/threonine protein kinase